MIRPGLRELFQVVRLSDIRPVSPAHAAEEFVLADLRDAAAVSEAMRDVDAVVHLGAVAKERDYDELLPANVHGVVNVFEAAHTHGVQRVVFASSMHVVGFYGRRDRVDSTSAPRPDSRYAVTKLFGEGLGAYYASKFGMGVTCLRIGHVTVRREESEPASWTAPADLVALIRLGLTHPDIRFEIFPAAAPCAGDDVGQRDLARRFGFRFTGHGESRASALRRVRHHFGRDAVAKLWRGGVFASTRKSLY